MSLPTLIIPHTHSPQRLVDEEVGPEAGHVLGVGQHRPLEHGPHAELVNERPHTRPLAADARVGLHEHLDPLEGGHEERDDEELRGHAGEEDLGEWGTGW